MNRESILKYISDHKTMFAQKYSVSKIGLFGSYARDEADESSDIDVVVELTKPDLFHLIGIKQTIEQALGRKVDIIRLREKMNPFLRQRIERDAIYV